MKINISTQFKKQALAGGLLLLAGGFQAAAADPCNPADPDFDPNLMCTVPIEPVPCDPADPVCAEPIDGTMPPPPDSACDTNGDGIVDKLELEQCGTTPPPPEGDPCDTNNDGVVDRLEMEQCSSTTAPPPEANPCDTNMDGFVDASEIEQCAGSTTGSDPCDFNHDGIVGPIEKEQCSGTSGTIEPNLSNPCDFNADGVIDTFEKEQCEVVANDPTGGDFCDFNRDGKVDNFEQGECAGETIGAGPCDFNADGILDKVENEACSGAPTCDPVVDATCQLPPPPYCSDPAIKTLNLPECQMASIKDFDLNPSTFDSNSWGTMTPEMRKAFGMDDMGFIPQDAFAGLDASQMDDFGFNGLMGLSLGQFGQIPDAAFAGLKSGNMGGLPNDVIRNMTREEFANFNTLEFQHMPGNEVSEFFVHFDPTKISPEDMREHMPEGWTFDAAGRIKPPAGAGIALPEFKTAMPTPFDFPTLPDFSREFAFGGNDSDGQDESFLNQSNKLIERFGFAMEQDPNSGVMRVNGSGPNGFALFPDPDTMRQAPEGTAPGIASGEDGRYMMTMENGQQYSFTPAPRDPTALANGLPTAKIKTGKKGDTLIDLGGDFAPAVIFDPNVVPVPEGIDPSPGAHPDANGDYWFVYDDGKAQKVNPTVPEPDTMKRLLAAYAGVTDVVFNSDGTFSLKYNGNPMRIEPSLQSKVTPLATGAEVSPELGVEMRDGTPYVKFSLQLPKIDTGTQARESDRTGRWEGDARVRGE